MALARRVEENRTTLVISEAQLGAARICGKRQNANDSSCQGDEWEMLHKQHCAVVHDAIRARKPCLDARLGRKVTNLACEFRI